jgi:hypothetical protein
VETTLGRSKKKSKENEEEVYVVGPKGLTFYTVTTLLTYKTKDKFRGFIVKVGVKNGLKSRVGRNK